VKTIKRIIAVILLIVIVALVGYLIYTGSQLSINNDLEGTYEAISSI